MLIVIGIFGFYTLISFPRLLLAHSHTAKATTVVPAKAVAATPPVTPPPTPPPAPPKPAPKPARTVKKVTTAAKPQPVVVPSPASNVSGLAPVAPTPSSSGGSSSQATPVTTTGYTSTNWSGYLSTAGNFTSISGAWTVPAAVGVGTMTTADSTWIGIGGVTSGDLIQVGTLNLINSSGQVTTSAFYELLPQVSQNIANMTVSEGDGMTATLTETSVNQWSVLITDKTNGQSFSTTLNYSSSHTSAEWIEEDPSFSFRRQIPFDNFKSATFNDDLTTLNGSSVNIGGSNALPVTMVDKTGQTIASLSALTGSGSGFTVTRTGL